MIYWIFNFAMKCPVHYCTIAIKRKDTADKDQLSGKLAKAIYHGGKSEVVAREALVKRYPRDSFVLATKLPAWEKKGKRYR